MLDSYVNDLEQRVALLEKELQKQRQTARGDDGTKPQSEEQLSWLSERPEGHRQDLPPHMHNPAAEAQRTLERISAAMRPAAASREFELSKTLLRCLLVNKSPASATGVPSLERHGQTAAGLVNDLGSDMVSLPSRDRANHLIDAYFQFANLCMPLLHEGSFQARVSMLYEMPHTIDFNNVHTTTETRLALFFLFEIFGIATLLMQKQDLLRVPTWLADRYHNVAMAALSEAGLPGGVLGVQVLTLMAQYSYHHAVLQDAWCIVGWALRLAVEVGLHRDPPPAESPDSLSLDTMRRTFWVAYSMDRNLSRSNLQPLFLPDGAITAKVSVVVSIFNLTLETDLPSNHLVPKCDAGQIHNGRRNQLVRVKYLSPEARQSSPTSIPPRPVRDPHGVISTALRPSCYHGHGPLAGKDARGPRQLVSECSIQQKPEYAGEDIHRDIRGHIQYWSRSVLPTNTQQSNPQLRITSSRRTSGQACDTTVPEVLQRTQVDDLLASGGEPTFSGHLVVVRIRPFVRSPGSHRVSRSSVDNPDLLFCLVGNGGALSYGQGDARRL